TRPSLARQNRARRLLRRALGSSKNPQLIMTARRSSGPRLARRPPGTLLLGVCLMLGIWDLGRASPAEPGVSSPNGEILFKVQLNQGTLQYAVSFKGKPVVEFSPMHFKLDDIELTDGVQITSLQPYNINETYEWRGSHSRATNNCNGLKANFK